MRDQGYGLKVANLSASALEQQAKLIDLIGSKSVKQMSGVVGLNSSLEAAELKLIDYSHNNWLGDKVWPWEEFSGCILEPSNFKRSGEAAATLEGFLETAEAIREPYIPRPIASLHVRQGDKWDEMNLDSFSGHMFYMYRIRRHVPHLRHVWLSSETQVSSTSA